MFPAIEFPFPYQLRVSKRARRMHLKLSANRGVQLVVPLCTSKVLAMQFLQQHIGWVEQHAHVWQVNKGQISLPENIFFPALQSNWYVEYQTQVLTKRSKLFTTAENKLTYFGPETPKLILSKLRQWVEAQAIEYLTNRVHQLAEQAQLKFNKLSFRHQHTLWGSCNKHKNISLNFKLIFLPVHLLDYVLLHELAHIQYLNHSPRFWQLVAQFVPNYKSCIKELHKQQFVPQWFEK